MRAACFVFLFVFMHVAIYVCCRSLDNADEPTRKALLDFNYQLAVGKLDEAFRAVAALKSPAMWRSMAHMAIKNKRLDVAGEHAWARICPATQPSTALVSNTLHCLDP
jgi:hypothetical protein